MASTGKLVIYGPEVPDITTIVYPNVIEVTEGNVEGSFIISNILSVGLSKALTGPDLNTLMAEAISFANP